MSKWEQHSVEQAVLDALNAVHSYDPDHHFGRPFMTAYQLAIAVNAAHPEIAQDLAVSVGGAGIGSRTSLAQYLGRELSRRYKLDPEHYPVEGRFLSNERLVSLTYQDAQGDTVASSLTGSGYELSIFRARANLSQD